MEIMNLPIIADYLQATLRLSTAGVCGNMSNKYHSAGLLFFFAPLFFHLQIEIYVNIYIYIYMLLDKASSLLFLMKHWNTPILCQAGCFSIVSWSAGPQKFAPVLGRRAPPRGDAAPSCSYIYIYIYISDLAKNCLPWSFQVYIPTRRMVSRGNKFFPDHWRLVERIDASK